MMPSGLYKLVVMVTVIAAVGAVLVLKGQRSPAPAADLKTGGDAAVPVAVMLPRLVDLGADKCIPCKKMAPILEDLKRDYAGVFDVQFIDVWKNPEEGRRYGARSIPCQIFFDEQGQERFRHMGFFSKQEILAKWKELGVRIEAVEPAPGQGGS